MEKSKEYYDSLDKRTKEYKDYIASQSQGLGDDIEKVLEATGIAKVAKAILGDDCGCEERKKKLNNLFPREQKVRRCFTDEERETYKNFMDTRIKNRWNKQEIDLLFDLYLAIYGRRYRTRRMCTTCPGTANILRKIQLELDRAFNN